MTTQFYGPLYKRDSKGKTRSWTVEVDSAGYYRTIAGIDGGNLVTSAWTAVEPKNVGKGNETSLSQQVDLEARALYQKKLDKHYVASLDAVKDERAYFEVMLAHKYEDHKHKLFDGSVIGVYTQPKLDGLRGPTTRHGTISRGGNEFVTVRFIAGILKPVFDAWPDVILDGELYNHDLRDDFNEIVSTIKRDKFGPADIIKVMKLAQLHVYDAYWPELPYLPFSARYERLREGLSAIDSPSVVLVETKRAFNHEQVLRDNDEYVAAGFEGTIVRADTPYEHKRTDKLLKLKSFLDDEFPIVRIEPGTGNWEGAAKRVICELEDGREFGAGSRGTRENQRQILREAERYTHATVRYQSLTPDGIPRFGVVTAYHEGPRNT